MSTLSRQHCEACHAGTPTLSPAEITAMRPEISAAWEIGADRLRRRLRGPDFGSVFALATRIALIAEQEGHHPDLSIGWGRLDVELTTHAAGGITRNDFILAAKIDAVAG